MIFEVCCHPEHSEFRASSILQTLDSIIQTLGYLELDAQDPRVTRFIENEVPSIPERALALDFPVAAETYSSHLTGDVRAQHVQTLTHPGYGSNLVSLSVAPGPTSLGESISMPNGVGPNDVVNPRSGAVDISLLTATRASNSPPNTGSLSASGSGGSPHAHAEVGCSCTLFKISSTSPQSAKTTPFWLATPGWNSGWSLAETRYEEQRRLVWSALTLAAAHVSFTHSLGQAPLDLAITKPWLVCFYSFLGSVASLHVRYGRSCVSFTWSLSSDSTKSSSLARRSSEGLTPAPGTTSYLVTRRLRTRYGRFMHEACCYTQAACMCGIMTA